MDSRDFLIGAFAGGVVTVVAYLFYKKRTAPTVQVNEEIWEWVDWKGRPRKITVHRRVKNV